MEGFADLTCLLKPCVYALKHRGQVVYVGRSRKALSRLYTHANAENARRKGYATMHYYHKLGFRFDEIWVRECGVKDAEQVEKEMIHKYMPKHNVNHKLAEPREPFTL